MSKVLRSLQRIQNMERFATRIYRTRTRVFADKESMDKLRAAIANEQEHADSLAACLERLGGRTSPLGFLFPIAGVFLGFITTLMGKALLFKAAVWIEERAVKDYGLYLKRVKFDSETVDLLQRIIEDEKRHITTWQSCLEALKG